MSVKSFLTLDLQLIMAGPIKHSAHASDVHCRQIRCAEQWSKGHTTKHDERYCKGVYAYSTASWEPTLLYLGSLTFIAPACIA